jgi:hypothetical protein
VNQALAVVEKGDWEKKWESFRKRAFQVRGRARPRHLPRRPATPPG